MRRLLLLVLLTGCLDLERSFYPAAIPKAVAAIAPLDGSTVLPPEDPVVVAFNGPVDPRSLSATLTSGTTDLGPLEVTAQDRTAEFAPPGGFAAETTYTFRLEKASVSGTLPLDPFSVTFTTAAAKATPSDHEIRTLFAGSCALSGCHLGKDVTGVDLSGEVTPRSLMMNGFGGCGTFTCTAFTDSGLDGPTCPASCDAAQMEWQVVEPGVPCQSCLLYLVKVGSMPQQFPYDLNPLSAGQVARIQRWIDGAQ